jgi:hypothetical protein
MDYKTAPVLSDPILTPDSPRLILTPMAGFLHNTLRFQYNVPTGPNETTARTRALVDQGWGGALVSVFVYRKLVITNIFFTIPEVNSSLVIGDVLSAHYAISLGRRFALVPGVGMTYHAIKTDLRNFSDTVTKQGVTATARFDEFHVRNHVFAPYPKLGLRISLPIQHWTITPNFSYLYEALKLTVSSPGGRVYIPPPIDEEKTIPPIEADEWKHYHSFRMGLDLFFDFHYALQLRVKMHYDVNHELFSLRAIGSAFFSRRLPLGMCVYFEYSQGIIHDNIYAFFGPSYLF